MPSLERDIKEFLEGRGVTVAGVAGPERLDGPPSVDPGYGMRGARSIISMALPMDVAAVYEFLSKRSPAPHNLDQFWNYQRLQKTGEGLAAFLTERGHRSRALPLSADYRRSPYVFSLKPAFSHRLGAIAAGIGAQGWSGNVMTRQYGAAVYLGTVVTAAVLRSDPPIPHDYFIRNFCQECRRCVNSCPSRMFSGAGTEYVLLGDTLHERGRRLNIDLCNISCFGLHALSVDRRWTNWGRHWIESWVDSEPDPGKRLTILGDMLNRGLTTGDSAPRFDVLRRICGILYPEATFDGICEVSELP